MKVKQVNYNFTVLLNYHLDGDGTYNGVHKWWYGTKKRVIFLGNKIIIDIHSCHMVSKLKQFTNGLWKIELPQITLQLLVCVWYVLNEKPKWSLLIFVHHCTQSIYLILIPNLILMSHLLQESHNVAKFKNVVTKNLKQHWMGASRI